MIHLKVVRIYIDSILRFGIPPKFYTGLIRADRGKDKGIIKALSDLFVDDSMREFYGSKEDAGDGEDYYPFSLVTLSVPEV